MIVGGRRISLHAHADTPHSRRKKRVIDSAINTACFDPPQGSQMKECKHLGYNFFTAFIAVWYVMELGWGGTLVESKKAKHVQ
jgi:hypothetical protein